MRFIYYEESLTSFYFQFKFFSCLNKNALNDFRYLQGFLDIKIKFALGKHKESIFYHSRANIRVFFLLQRKINANILSISCILYTESTIQMHFFSTNEQKILYFVLKLL